MNLYQIRIDYTAISNLTWGIFNSTINSFQDFHRITYNNTETSAILSINSMIFGSQVVGVAPNANISYLTAGCVVYQYCLDSVITPNNRSSFSTPKSLTGSIPTNVFGVRNISNFNN
jgi:hypothetical protein